MQKRVKISPKEFAYLFSFFPQLVTHLRNKAGRPVTGHVNLVLCDGNSVLSHLYCMNDSPTGADNHSDSVCLFQSMCLYHWIPFPTITMVLQWLHKDFHSPFEAFCS